MGNRTTNAPTTYDIRYLIAGMLAMLLVVAIGIPLYLAGTPNVRGSENGLQPPAATGAASNAVVALAPATATPFPGARPAQAPAATNGAAAPGSPAPVDESPLARAVASVIGGQPGIYGVVIARPGEEPAYQLNADVPFVAASLYKLVLLADIYDGVARGTVDPDLELELLPEYFPTADEPQDSYFPDPATSPPTVSLDEAMFAAGAYSSNVAARALLSLTDGASLRVTAAALGMTESSFFVDPRDLAGWPPAEIPGVPAARLEEAVRFAEAQADAGPVMLTTPRDIARYFDALLAGKVVNQTASDAILSILEQQAVDDRFPCLLPPNTRLAHKTGNLDHVVHDVGVVWNGDQPTIVVAMVEDPVDDVAATAVIQRLALIAYDLDADPLAAAATPAAPSCGVVAEEEVPAEAEALDDTIPTEDAGIDGTAPADGVSVDATIPEDEAPADGV